MSLLLWNLKSWIIVDAQRSMGFLGSSEIKTTWKFEKLIINKQKFQEIR